MTPTVIVAFGVFFLAFLLTGIAWYAMTLNPSKYRRPRIWMYGATALFLLYTAFLALITKPSSLADIILDILFGLFGCGVTILGLWIPMLQRDWIRGWHNSQRANKTKKPDR